MSMGKIMVADDDTNICELLRLYLEKEGYTVTLAHDGESAVEQFFADTPDLLLLDIMMPRLDGYSVCEMIRNESSTPVILLTALDDEDNQMKGFNLLADDYITKPFSMPLVLKRMEAVLRRARSGEKSSVLVYQNVQLDTENYKVFVEGKEVALTVREFDILRLLMENQGRVFTREQLLDIIWNYDYLGDDKIINTHIKNIRKKLGVDCIETIRGVGYRIDKNH